MIRGYLSPNHAFVEELKMAFRELIAMKKSSKYPQEGDVFILQPQKNLFYFGKVIRINLKSTDSLIKGMALIYIYDSFSSEKVVPKHFDEKELLIPPIIVNNQPWNRGYFETVDSISVSEREKNLEFGFWDLLTQEYVDIQGKKIKNKPKYCGIYGLGSYGIVGKEVQKAIESKK